MNMRTLWICCFALPALLLSACANRPSAQPAAQQHTQSVSPQPPPATGAQLASSAPEKPSPAGTQLAYRNQKQNPAPAPEQQPAISIPAGTRFEVRLDQTLDTRRNRAGDRFSATLRYPIVVDGETVLARGTRCEGHLIEAKRSGRLKGRAVLAMSLDSFNLDGRVYNIRTTSAGRVSGRHRKRNWILIGGGSGLGTALGAIAGGPAGALIGAGAGGAAGFTGAFITGRKNLRLPAETVLSFRLRDSVEL